MKRLIMLAVLCLFSCGAYADTLKVGVVNLDEVVQKSPLAISFNQKISKDFKPRQDALYAAQKQLQDNLDKLNYNGFQMTMDERNKLQTTINDQRRSLEALNASFQKDFTAAQSSYNQSLMNKLNSIIAKIGQDEKYDIIQTSVNILFLNDAVNITPKVIEQMK
jgi:outer membrane protein